MKLQLAQSWQAASDTAQSCQRGCSCAEYGHTHQPRRRKRARPPRTCIRARAVEDKDTHGLRSRGFLLRQLRDIASRVGVGLSTSAVRSTSVMCHSESMVCNALHAARCVSRSDCRWLGIYESVRSFFRAVLSRKRSEQEFAVGVALRTVSGGASSLRLFHRRRETSRNRSHDTL